MILSGEKCVHIPHWMVFSSSMGFQPTQPFCVQVREECHSLSFSHVLLLSSHDHLVKMWDQRSHKTPLFELTGIIMQNI